MLDTVVTLRVVLLIALIVIAFMAGLLIKKARLNTLRERIKELEGEVVQSHAEILGLQQESVKGLKEKTGHSIPVIQLKGKDENPNKNIK
ncbi:MAG TPA: hypothetical protein VM012_11480 [Flavitalea sp.]|nr:hypothetical protein [Flavitalea sp.]